MQRVVPLSERYPPGVASIGVSLAAGVAAILGSFGAAGFTPSFVVAPVSGTLSKQMPGVVITFAITVLGDLGQKLNLVAAVAIVCAVVAALTWAWLRLGRKLDVRWLPFAGTTGSVWVFAAVLTGRPTPAIGAGLGAGAVVAVTDFSRSTERFVGVVDPDGRRQLLSAIAAAIGVSIFGYSRGERKAVSQPIATSGSPSESDTHEAFPDIDVSRQLDTAAQRSFDIGGMDPLISEGFYEVDINNVNPAIDPDQWALSITGEVEETKNYNYEDILEREFEHRYATLRCVGENLNGHKMDTALWTGIPVAPLLDAAGPHSDCNCVMLRAADGYFEEFPLDALRPGLLAFGMNGKPLPRGHGAPVRALVPGHWGEVNVKWLTEIELLEKEQTGYWEKRGWHGTGPVKTVAKLHATDRVDDDTLVVGGHTYAGTRGIEAVQVSTDGGNTWNEATLTEPLPGDDVWRQWRYTYEPPEETHDVVVRARDGTGRRQPKEREGSFPSGPSGWVRKEIDPSVIT